MKINLNQQLKIQLFKHCDAFHIDINYCAFQTPI